MPTVAFKTYNAAQKSTWRDLVIPHGVEDAVHGLSRNRFVEGLDAVYLHSRVTLTRSDSSFWICLDIEDTKTPGHSDVSANLECAKDLLIFLDKKGVTDNLSIFLTGNAFRFSWPFYVPMEYKRAFLAWIQKQSGIDSSPQTGNAFLRVMGYRGHPRQGEPRDQHIHKLDDIHDLWFMDADEYMDLTGGQPDYDQSMGWLDEILPTKAMPESWKLFLDHWKTFSELQQTIWKPDYSRQHLVDHEATWNQIYPHLDAMGIYYTEKTINDFWILKLSLCPECGRKNGSPYITAPGRLKCFHANSCRAGEMSEAGRMGLSPIQWVDDFEKVELEEPERNVTFKTVNHARAELAAKIVQHNDMFFRCDPGTGKTYTALEQIVPLCTTRKVLYLSPTNRLNGETFDLAKTFSQCKVNIFRIEGRSKTNCHNYKKVMDAAEKGFSPGLMFCHYCQKDNPSPCVYQEQFKAFEEPAGLYITTHDQAKFIDIEGLGFDTMIVDEDPLQAFFEKEWSGQGAVFRFGAGYQGDFFERLTKGLGKIYESCDGADREDWAHNRAYTTAPPEDTPWENSNTLWEIAQITEDEREQLAGHLAAYARWADESQMKWQWRLYKDGVNIKALNWLWTALGERGGGTAYVRVDLRSGVNPYKFFLTRNAVPEFSGQIIVLDGTGNKPDTDALFHRDFELIDTCIDLETCHKHLIKQGLGKIKCKKLSDGQKKNLLRLAAQSLRPTDQKILIATHQIIEDEILQMAVALIPDRSVDSIHFYGNRGMNIFKDYDAIICFGAPGTNQTERLDEAMALFTDAAERKRWFQQKADAELLQTIHRIRPVNGSKNIILLSNRWLSELGPLHTETDRRRGTQKTEHIFSKAYEMLKAFYEIHGFVSLEAAYALGIGPYSKKDLLLMVQAKSSLCLIKIYILDKVSIQLPPSDQGLILLQGQNSWSKLMKKIQSELQAPPLKNRVHSHWQAAVGNVQAAKIFAEKFGLKFNPENWREDHESS